MLSLKQKINQANNSNKNHRSNLTTNRDNLENTEISNSNIELHFISEENNENNNSKENENENENKNVNENEEQLNKKNSNNLLSFEENEEENSIKDIEENEEEKEKKLEFLYHKYINSYKKKRYENIIKDIGYKQNLFFKGSPMSFNIFLLKIKCLLKNLKSEYMQLISLKNEKKNFFEITKKISKMLKEFKSLSEIINPDNKLNYEQVTQIYCKFLLYLSLISKLKEEYIKSFEYLIIGINSLKIFFIKQIVATTIKTYSIYCKLLLLLINQLIGDNNYIKALFYCNITFKVIEIGFKFMKSKNMNQKSHLKFLEYIGYNYLYTGLCLEQNKNINYQECFEAYREAKYFLKKAETNKNNDNLLKSIAGGDSENINICLSEILIEKIKKQLNEENLVKTLMNKQIIKNKNIKNDVKEKENNLKLKLLSYSYHKNLKKYIPLERNIYKNLLTTNTQNNIEKLDNELISVIYKHINNNSESKRPLSYNIKKNLCNLNVYNILLSNKFRDFIIKNNNFEFNNPVKEKQSIEKLRKYLNKEIEININSEKSSPLKNISNSNKNLNNENNKIKNDKNIFKNKLNKNTRNNFKKKILLRNGTFSVDKNEINNRTTYNYFLSNTSNINNMNSKNKKINTKNTNTKQEINVYNMNKTEKELNNNNKLKIIKQLNHNSSEKFIYSYTENKNKNKNNKNIFTQQKLRIKSPIIRSSNSLLQNDFERKFLDNNLLSGKYFKKFFYLDSLTTKELSFQKKILDLKDSNSKLYFGDYIKELKNGGKVAREEVYKKYLELNNKAIEEAKKMQIDDFMNCNNKKKDLNLYENSNNVLKILNKFIRSSKEKRIKKIKIYSESFKNIKKNNEEKLLNLNNGIKELNYFISFQNKKLNNHKKINNYE